MAATSATAKTEDGGYVFLYKGINGVRLCVADKDYKSRIETVIPKNELGDIAKFFADQAISGQLSDMLKDGPQPVFPEEYEPKRA